MNLFRNLYIWSAISCVLVTGTIVLFQTWHMLLFSILLNMCSHIHSTQIVNLVLIKIELNLRDMREKYFFH